MMKDFPDIVSQRTLIKSFEPRNRSSAMVDVLIMRTELDHAEFLGFCCFDLSNEESPGKLLYRGDEILPIWGL